MRRFARTSVLALTMASLAVSTAAEAGEKKNTSTKFAQVVEPTSFAEAERGYDGMFANRPAVQRVRVPGQFFVSKPRDGMVPASLVNKVVEIDIRSSTPRLSDLQTMLEIQGVPLTVDWRSLSNVPDPDAKVGTFTAASRYQAITNSAGGNGGNQNGNNGGFGGGLGGGLGGGSYGNGFGGASGGFGGNSGSIGSGTNSTPNIQIIGSGGGGGQGASTDGEGGSSTGNVSSGTVQGAADKIPKYPNAQGSGYGTSGDGAKEAEESKSPRFYDRVLPFRYFKGTMGELAKRLENSGELAVWYDNGLIVGETRRYSVAIMQNIDVSQSVVNELIRLGARDVVGSIGAGQIFYAAAPRVNAELIEPYLRRVSTNLSEITLQVALVTVAMTKNAERGFDWSAFNLQLGNGTASSDGGAGTTYDRNTGSFSNGAFRSTFGIGLSNPLTVAGAIRFLSRVGDTSVTQNVELRTLSGAPVALRSGENIPYVQNVGATSGGGLSSSTFGSSQTASLGTGITLNVDPRYDASSGIVTMDVGVKLVDLVEFVQLSAGNQLGTISQPRTREQGLNSIIRVPAGQTTIVGGIRRDQASDSRTAPFGLWGIGSRNRERNVFWLFTIVRPVVTVYETSDIPYVPKSVLDTTVTVNPSDERPVWQRDQYRVDQAVINPPQGPVAVRQVPGGYVPQARGYGTDIAPTTPPNRQPGAVVISQPPAPRNVIVGAPSSPPEVTSALNAPANSVVRVPVSPTTTAENPGNRVTNDGSAVNVPLAPSPADDHLQTTIPTEPLPPSTVVPSGRSQTSAGVPAADVAPTQAAPRSFLRPMTEAERKGSN